MIIIYHDKHLTVMQTVYRSCPYLSQTFSVEHALDIRDLASATLLKGIAK
jgi:hypothetical protein